MRCATQVYEIYCYIVYVYVCVYYLFIFNMIVVLKRSVPQKVFSIFYCLIFFSENRFLISYHYDYNHNRRSHDDGQENDHYRYTLTM